MLARDVLRTDGEFQIAGDALRLGPGASSHVLPWVANSVGYSSRIGVQNTSADSGTCVQIVHYDGSQTQPSLVDPLTTPQPGGGCGYYLRHNASLRSNKRRGGKSGCSPGSTRVSTTH